MSWLEILILVIIAALCGGIGQAIGGFSRGGFLVAIAVGFIGALLGLWLARLLGLPELLAVNVGGVTFPVLWSIIGAAIFMAVIGLLSGRRVVYYD